MAEQQQIDMNYAIEVVEELSLNTSIESVIAQLNTFKDKYFHSKVENGFYDDTNVYLRGYRPMNEQERIKRDKQLKKERLSREKQESKKKEKELKELARLKKKYEAPPKIMPIPSELPKSGKMTKGG